MSRLMVFGGLSEPAHELIPVISQRRPAITHYTITATPGEPQSDVKIEQHANDRSRGDKTQRLAVRRKVNTSLQPALEIETYLQRHSTQLTIPSTQVEQMNGYHILATHTHTHAHTKENHHWCYRCCFI